MVRGRHGQDVAPTGLKCLPLFGSRKILQLGSNQHILISPTLGAEDHPGDEVRPTSLLCLSKLREYLLWYAVGENLYGLTTCQTVRARLPYASDP